MMMRHISAEMEEADTTSELAKTITFLHAIMWITKSWSIFESSTMQKRFRKCGFHLLFTTEEQKESANPEENLRLSSSAGSWINKRGLNKHG